MSGELRAFVSELNASRPGYHRIEFPDGVVLNGQVDLLPHIGAFGLPPSLHGVSVLDVGTATGFLALECARRGGSVTAIDVYDGLPVERLARLSGLSVRFVRASIYDLDEGFGRFDLVVCGSLLMHLPDQVGALRALRRVCAGRLVVSTTCIPESTAADRPMFELIGIDAGDHWTYWTATTSGLVKLCRVAGFDDVDHVAYFTLRFEPPSNAAPVEHVVVGANARRVVPSEDGAT